MFRGNLAAMLARPTFGQGLFQVGQQAGMTPTIPGQNEALLAEQQKQKALQGGLLGMAQTVGNGATPEQVAAMGQGLAGQGASAEQVMAAQQMGQQQVEAAKAAKMERMKQEQQAGVARQITSQLENKGFPELAKVFSAAGNTGQVPEGIRKAAAKALFGDTVAAKTQGVPTSREIGTVRDENGNEFYGVNVFDPNTKEAVVEWVPLNNNEKEPSGDYNYIDTRYGESGEQRKARDTSTYSAKVTSKNFIDRQAAAIETIPQVRARVNKMETALNLLSQVPTGGPINTANTALEKYFGQVNATKGELMYLLGSTALSELKPTFGGSQITDSERKAITDLFGSMSKSNPENEAILNNLLGAAKTVLKNTEELAGSNSYEEWRGKVLDEPKEEEEEASETKTVKWSDL